MVPARHVAPAPSVARAAGRRRPRRRDTRGRLGAGAVRRRRRSALEPLGLGEARLGLSVALLDVLALEQVRGAQARVLDRLLHLLRLRRRRGGGLSAEGVLAAARRGVVVRARRFVVVVVAGVVESERQSMTDKALALSSSEVRVVRLINMYYLRRSDPSRDGSLRGRIVVVRGGGRQVVRHARLQSLLL